VPHLEDEKTDLCRHFGECGGCQSQDMPYEEQLAAKEAMLRELFQEHWDGPIPVEASPVIWHYRNKVDPAFGRKFYPEPPPKDFVRETVLGFKRPGRWYDPLEIEECLIGPDGMGELMGAVRSWLREQGLQGYNNRNKQGFLRVLLVRDGKRTGERMVVLVTSDGEFDKASFVEAVQGVFPCTSIHRAIYRGAADLAAADEIELLHGEPTIDEKLCIPDGDAPRDLTFRLSPFSFFQTNTLGAERLYAKIRTWVKQVAPATLYDLYGGAGSIAFVCSDLVGQVHSVENVEEATIDGRFNAGVNEIENVTFYTEKVKNYLRNIIVGPGALEEDSAVVVDPPRSGLHPKALRRLVELAPKNLLYVSCKPTVLAQELPALLERYRLDDMSAVDMFPHTRHVELVAALSLRE
jgi:23S rRNA (uracil1939-C5)-methyltransferase